MITIPITQSLASSPERKVAQILGPEVFEGISGGLDTLGEIYFVTCPLAPSWRIGPHKVSVIIHFFMRLGD